MTYRRFSNGMKRSREDSAQFQGTHDSRRSKKFLLGKGGFRRLALVEFAATCCCLRQGRSLLCSFLFSSSGAKMKPTPSLNPAASPSPTLPTSSFSVFDLSPRPSININVPPARTISTNPTHFSPRPPPPSRCSPGQDQSAGGGGKPFWPQPTPSGRAAPGKDGHLTTFNVAFVPGR